MQPSKKIYNVFSEKSAHHKNISPMFGCRIYLASVLQVLPVLAYFNTSIKAVNEVGGYSLFSLNAVEFTNEDKNEEFQI